MSLFRSVVFDLTFYLWTFLLSILAIPALGLSGPQETLEPMKIADIITYDAFFDLPRDLYTIKLTVQRPSAQLVVLDFKYDYRR